MTFNRAALLLERSEDGLCTVILHNADGNDTRLPAVTPAEDLINATEIDYREYRSELKHLREAHPLFEPKLDVAVTDFEDFVTKALRLPAMLREIDPVSFFVLDELLHSSLQMTDDGSASFLLNTGMQLLDILAEPVRVQIYLRNIFEMTFDGMERTTQQERFAKLRSVYPDIAQLCNPELLSNQQDGRQVFAARDLLELRLLELALYFGQEKQRIARCEYCWGYFIPKTKKATRYCDRTIDGFPCKQRGARFKRNEDMERDSALLICKQLRDRMYARLLRYTNAPPIDRADLIPMDYEQYDEWSENARLARIEYLNGNLTAEQFLRRIDTTHELDTYEAEKATLVSETAWQKKVSADVGFDADTHYPETFMFLDLGKPNPQWEVFTADDLREKDQVGRQSLKEKYGKKNKKTITDL